MEIYFEDSPKRTAILVRVQLKMANCLVKLPQKVRKVVVHKVKMACSTSSLVLYRSIAFVIDWRKLVLSYAIRQHTSKRYLNIGDHCGIYFEDSPKRTAILVRGQLEMAN